MDPRPPVPFGPFPSSAMLEEENRRAVGRALSCAAAQAAILLAAILSLGLAGALTWVQLARYEAALAACAGV